MNSSEQDTTDEHAGEWDTTEHGSERDARDEHRGEQDTTNERSGDRHTMDEHGGLLATVAMTASESTMCTRGIGRWLEIGKAS